ncbi:hypothetical protein SAMN05421679_104387 [Epilithonimonas pallida]|jgi:hypothetical protein|uniref:Uncharacterized protein n=2 Tax=Epilithonimonas pallida TaxID=373671 RepID=A0ABY1R3A8_9FLAO|nr:hypothetical protein SAMN05421679_104387 [Epilithonimonas pallida]
MKNLMFTILGIMIFVLSCSKKDTGYQNSGVDSSTVTQDNAATNNQAGADTASIRTDTATTRVDSVQRR